MTATSGPSAPEQVQPVRPDRVGAHLVDLVHGNGVAARASGRRRWRTPRTRRGPACRPAGRARRCRPTGAGRRSGCPARRTPSGPRPGGPGRPRCGPGRRPRPGAARRPRPVRPTLAAKYSTARAEMSSALAWNPYGVSSRTAGTGSGPSRSKSCRWGLTMVGAVSPEPMMASSRAIREKSRPGRVVDQLGHQVGVLGVQVVVAARSSGSPTGQSRRRPGRPRRACRPSSAGWPGPRPAGAGPGTLTSG